MVLVVPADELVHEYEYSLVNAAALTVATHFNGELRMTGSVKPRRTIQVLLQPMWPLSEVESRDKEGKGEKYYRCSQVKFCGVVRAEQAELFSLQLLCFPSLGPPAT